jgi:predicted nucleic acid-binding protein
MKQSIFIDTDVVLDFLTGRQPFAMDAAIVFSLNVENKINAFIAPLTFSNCYYIIRKVMKHDNVIAKLTELLDIIDVSLMNKDTVTNALRSDFKDFEDSLQYYSAINNDKIDIILTRNIKDYKHSDIAMLSPDTYIK